MKLTTEMGKLTQRQINKQIGKGGFKEPAKCCGGMSTIQRIITQSIPVDNGESLPIRCFVWNYTMTDPADVLDYISLDDINSSTTTINLNEPLSDSEFTIYQTIVTAFNAQSVAIQSANITKTDLGAGLFEVQIYLYGLQYVNLIGQAAGSASFFNETTCDADYIQDNNSLNILDSLNLPLIST